MVKIQTSSIDASKFFNVNDLDYPKGQYIYKYRNEVTELGQINEDIIEIAIVDKYTGELLISYTKFKDYTNDADEAYTSLTSLLTDLSVLLGFNGGMTTPDVAYENFIFVTDISDLPTPVDNIITLNDETAYYFTKSIDLLGKRLVAGVNTVLLGSSSENVILRSTGLTGVALITSNYSLPIRNITITSNVALNLDGNGTTTALDWFGVNFTNCDTIGTIKDYTNHVWTDCAFLESGNLTYDGTIGSIAVNSSLFNTASGQTAFIIPSTCTITRRIRFNLCAFIILSGETGINLSTSAVIPNEGYIARVCNFSGGGTYITGVTYNDNKAQFRENTGVPNSGELSQYYTQGNTTATIITTTATPVKINLSSIGSSSITQRFTNTINKSTYIGAVTRNFEVRATISLISGNNHQIGVHIAKNGIVIPDSLMVTTTSGIGKSENITVHTLISLSTNDYIEIFVSNITATTNITVSEINVIIR